MLVGVRQVTYPVRLKGHPWLTFSTSLAFRAPVLSLSLSQITLDNWSERATSVSLAEPRCYYEWTLLGRNTLSAGLHINISEKWNVIVLWAVLCMECQMLCSLLLITVFFQLATNSRIFQPSLYHTVSYKHDRDTEISNRNRAALPDFHPSSGDNTTCTFSGGKAVGTYSWP
jgi:hypothetical protein